MMQKLLLILVLIANLLLFQSQACLTSTKKAALNCSSYPSRLNGIVPLSTTAYFARKYQTSYLYLSGNRTNNNTLRVSNIQCIRIKYDGTDCSSEFESSYIPLYISLEHIMDDTCVMKLDNKDVKIRRFLRDISSRKPYYSINLTCTVERLDDGSKDFSSNSLTGTSLFSVIFLSSCLVFTCGLCIGWFAFVYYRRFNRDRIKKQQQKALERSLRKLLDKLPIITFNSKNKNQDFMDDDPICAICLESFVDNEKLRKLVCAHYFHIVCIDPWVLTHQNCPLCNQNILNDSVPSISARMTSTNDELHNQEFQMIAPPTVINNHPITTSQNSYL